MPIVNGYCERPELAGRLRIEDQEDDLELDDAITAASRWIDGHTEQRFWLDDVVADRDFEACDLYELKVDPIGTSTGVVVKLDEAGDGTFETTLASSDWQLRPVNAAQASPEAKPFTRIRMVGSYTLPIPYGSALARRERVRVTAKWGWPAVPTAVKRACLELAAETFKLRDAPFGVAGTNDFGLLRVGPQTLNRVMGWLEPYSPKVVAR